MTLIFHQIAKDLRAVRWPLALWLVVLIADGLVLGLQLDRYIVDRDSANRLNMAVLAVGYAGMALGWFIAARIIQADPLDTTTAFWLTRPLGPGALLGSKLLLIGALFLLLPCAVATGVAAANGVGGPTLLHFAAERLTIDTALLLPIAVAAAVSRSLPRFALTVAAAGLLSAVAAVAFALPFSWRRDPTHLAGLAMFSGRVVAIGGAMAVSLCLIVHQYLTRRTRRTLIAGASAVVLFFATWNLWPWPLWAPTRFQPAAIDAGVFDATPVRVEFDQASLRRTDPSPGEIGVRGTYQVHGLPSGWVAHVRRGRGEIRFATAPAVSVPGGDVWMPYGGSEKPGALAGDVISAFEHALGARIVNAPQQRGAADAYLLRVAATTFPKFQGVQAEYSARLTLLARRAEAGASMPLRPGARASLRSVQLTIVSVERGAIHVRGTGPTLFFPWGEPEIRMALRNGRRGEAVLLAKRHWPRTSPGMLNIGMLLFRSEIGLENSDGAETVPDAQWMADAELVMLALEPVGTFDKTVTITGFVLPQR